jgi:hypothetical protein
MIDHILFIAPTELTISAMWRFIMRAPSINMPISQTNTVAMGMNIDNINATTGPTAARIPFSNNFAIPVRAVLPKALKIPACASCGTNTNPATKIIVASVNMICVRRDFMGG